MAEQTAQVKKSPLETITLYNPTNENFTHGFNGDPYTIPAKQKIQFPQALAKHLAKHLATNIVMSRITKKQAKEQPTLVAQKTVYDNTDLRIALYDIIGDIKIVEETVASYPYKGFIGDMQVYKDYVAKQESKVDNTTDSNEVSGDSDAGDDK